MDEKNWEMLREVCVRVCICLYICEIFLQGGSFVISKMRNGGGGLKSLRAGFGWFFSLFV